MINSLGNLGAFFGSWYVGVMKDLTGSYAGGLYGLALFGLISAFISAFFSTSRTLPPPRGHRGRSQTKPHWTAYRDGAGCSLCAIIYQENKNALENSGTF